MALRAREAMATTEQLNSFEAREAQAKTTKAAIPKERERVQASERASPAAN